MDAIHKTVDELSNDIHSNKDVIVSNFGSLLPTLKNGYTLLHLFSTSRDIDQNKLMLIFNTLLFFKVDPNAKDNNGNTFIHLIIKNKILDYGYLIELIRLAYKFGYNVNLMNYYSETILHCALSYYRVPSVSFLKVLEDCEYNFCMANCYDEDLIFYIKNNCKYNKDDKEQLIKFILSMRENGEDYYMEDTTVKNNPINREVLKYGSMLTGTIYDFEPAYGRENEVSELIVSLAQPKKSVLIVGPSGCGKTALVNELAYLIQNGLVPNFLNDAEIFQVTSNDLLAGTRYRGDFEDKIKKVLDFCVKNNYILFIDEFHTIFGAGASDTQPNNDMSQVLKEYTENKRLKVIGATTDTEYYKFVESSALKRRFDILKLSEPNDKMLENIIVGKIEEFADEFCMSTKKIDGYLSELVSILIELTNKSHRDYKDMVSNPDLVLAIVGKAFAYARVMDEDIDISCFIKAVNSASRLYDSAIKNAVSKLENIKPNRGKKKAYTNTNVINFSDYVKK